MGLYLMYTFLQKNVVDVELKQDLEVGHADDYDTSTCKRLKNFINDEGEVIIPKGTLAELKVQPFNYHFEMKFENGLSIDVAFDDDDELNKYAKFISYVGPNKYFMNSK